jgi:hypothetical protein
MDLKPCPECSNLTALDNDKCPYCGYSFDISEEDAKGSDRKAGRRPVMKQIRNPMTAALCAILFPGWGQWYNGRTTEGIHIIAAYVSTVIITVMLMYIFRDTSLFVTIVSVLATLILVAIWVYSISTAYNTARAINRGGTAYSGKSILFFMPATLWFLLVCTVVFIIASRFIPGLPGADMLPLLFKAVNLIPLRIPGL